MEYCSAIKKNTFESVLMRWMKLEPIIQSEVSQKEILKIRAEINAKETKETIAKINKAKSWFFERIN